MAGAKNHDYHILPPDIWPFMGAMSALVMTSGGVFYMHKMAGGTQIMLLGLLGVLLTMFSWWGKVIKEAHAGDHTPVVQLHQRYGMILFIASEVMFFVGWFWAYFDFSLFPSKLAEVVGGQWPPKGVEAVINAWDLPLVNTLTLLLSGTTDEGQIAKTLPQLVGFGAFPTSIFIDRNGHVHQILAGFTGPSTGPKYQEVQRRMDELTREIVGSSK